MNCLFSGWFEGEKYHRAGVIYKTGGGIFVVTLYAVKRNLFDLSDKMFLFRNFGVNKICLWSIV